MHAVNVLSTKAYRSLLVFIMYERKVFLVFMKCILTKTPQVSKRSGQVLKGLVEKMWNWNGQLRHSAFDRLKVLVMMTSLQIIVISDAQGLLMLMGLKFLTKMTRLQTIKIKSTLFCGFVILIKFFYLIDINRPWETLCCSKGIMTKSFNQSNLF